MDLLFGTKGFLPLMFFGMAAVAITTSDPFTKVVTGVLAAGILAGLLWEPVSKLIAKVRRRGD